MGSGPVFDSLVMAGGGCRCVWQVGFLEVVAPAIDLRPRQVAAVSAGAAMSCLVFSGRVEEGVAYFTDRVAANARNFYPANLLGDEPVFPHEEIYRATIEHVCDAEALRRLREGPDIRVLLARPPAWLGAIPSVFVGFCAYNAEKILAPAVHPHWTTELGFGSEVVSVRECETVSELADLILQSSCTPPFTPLYERADRPALDGGLIDNVPVRALAPGAFRTLVLLTRRYDSALLPDVEGRSYVQPSSEIPIDKWDYTDASLLRDTLELGRRDGEAFLAAGAF